MDLVQYERVIEGYKDRALGAWSAYRSCEVTFELWETQGPLRPSAPREG